VIPDRCAATAARAVLSALLVMFAAACTESTFAAGPAELDISTTADSLVSDGLASIVVSVELPPAVPQDAMVEFTTTLGRWANPGGTPDRKVTVQARGGTAEARLFASGDVGNAFITVAAAGTSDTASVRLTPALPDTIDLFLDRTSAPADGATAVTATAVLRRTSGTVSKNIPVRFEAQDSAQAALPALSGVVVADSTGKAQFRFTSIVPGTVQIRAFAGTAASEPRAVRLTPPPSTPAAVRTAGSVPQRGGISPVPFLEVQ
jgi:hypothetical protein